MFDNLRDSASSFYEEEPNDLYKEPDANLAAKSKRRKRWTISGDDGQTEIFLSLMLMFMVCIMGTLAMLVLGKMSFF